MPNIKHVLLHLDANIYVDMDAFDFHEFADMVQLPKLSKVSIELSCCRLSHPEIGAQQGTLEFPRELAASIVGRAESLGRKVDVEIDDRTAEICKISQ